MTDTFVMTTVSVSLRVISPIEDHQCWLMGDPYWASLGDDRHGHDGQIVTLTFPASLLCEKPDSWSSYVSPMISVIWFIHQSIYNYG